MNKKKQKNFIIAGMGAGQANALSRRGQKFFAPVFFKKAAFLILAFLSACAASPPPPVPYGPVSLGIAKRGWHTEIAIPEASLTGPLASLGPAQLHRHYLLFGFGARAYFTNPQAGAGTALEALLPGPSAINLAAFDDLNDGSGRQTIWLHVSQADIDGILAFIWRSLPHQGAAPIPIVIVNNASMFYAARPDYNAFYNCNNWAVDALRAGSLPFSNKGLHFSSGVQAEAERIAEEQK